MNNNPYAPPISAVADIGDSEREPLRRSKILAIIGWNAALIGLFCLMGGVFSTVSRSEQGVPIGGTVTLGFWGAIAIAAAIGIFRRRRWAVILWCVLAGLFALLVFFAPIRRPLELAFVLFLVAQFVGSLLGLWGMLRKRKRDDTAETGAV